MAGRIEGITVEIGGDAAGLQKEIKKINSSLQATTRELKGVDSLLRLDPGNVDLLRQKEELLNKSLAEQEAKLKQLKTSKQNLDQSMANGTEVNQKEYRNLVREIAATENKVNQLKKSSEEFGSVAKQIKLQGLETAKADFNKLTQSIEKTKSELKDIDSLLRLDPGNVDLLRQKEELLNKSLEDQEQKLNSLKNAQNQLGKTEIGNKQYQKLTREISSAENEVKSLKTQIKSFGSIGKQQAKAVGKSFEEAGDKIKNAGSKLKTATAGIAAGAIGVVEGTKELNRDLSRLEINAETAGVSVNFLEDQLAGAVAVTGETDSSVEALSNLLAAGFDATNFQEALEGLEGAALKFSDTLKLEGLADGLQETLATGAAVGPFAELLERSGISLDEFNKGLVAAKENGEETNYALQTLADLGLADVYNKWAENNEALSSYEENLFNLQSALVDLANVIMPLLTPIIETITEVIKKFTELPEGVQTGIASFVGIIAVLAPVLSVIGGIVRVIGLIAGAFSATAAEVAVVAAAIAGAVIGVSTLLYAMIAGVTEWFKGFKEKCKNAFDFSDIAGNVKFYASEMRQSWNNFLQFFINLGGNIKNAAASAWSGVKNIATSVATAIKAVWSSVTGFFSNLWSTIKSLATSAANGIKNVWHSVVAFIRTIPGKIVAVFSSLPSRMAAVGRNIVQGIIRGVTGAAGALFSSLRNLANRALEAAKSALGIHSPSRVMQEVVGKNIVLGISSGIYKYADNATDAMKETSQNILSEAKKILDIQESLGELTTEQELAYWKEVKKLTGIQGEELLQIDKKIAEAEKKILDEQQKAQEEQLKEYENRVDKLAGFADIFSEVKFESVSGDKLTENLQDQVYALEEYAEIMQKLTEKGISSGLLAELQEQGVGAIDELRALARMGDDELLRYDSLYTQKMQLAAEQAAKELGQASTNIVDSVAEAVDTLNTNATIVVQNGQDNQTAMLSNISTEVANIVGQSLAGGLAGIANLIVSAMPEILRLDMDSKKVAESSWGAFGELANTRGRIFAPSESQIRDIAMNVINSVLASKPTTT